MDDNIVPFPPQPRTAADAALDRFAAVQTRVLDRFPLLDMEDLRELLRAYDVWRAAYYRAVDLPGKQC